MKNLIEVEEAIVQWSSDRGILTNGKAITQCLKLGSEFGELCDNLAKGKDVKDDIGDMFVVLTNIARLEGTTLVECANVAYEDIKDRKGFLNANGNFIKSTDTNYAELLAEFEGSKVEGPKCINVELAPIGPNNYTFLFDDNSSITIELSSKFKNDNPNGPRGLTKSFIMENN